MKVAQFFWTQGTYSFYIMYQSVKDKTAVGDNLYHDPKKEPLYKFLYLHLLWKNNF